MKVKLKVWVRLIEFELTHSCWCTTTSPTSLKPILSHNYQVFLLFPKLFTITIHCHVVSFDFYFIFVLASSFILISVRIWAIHKWTFFFLSMPFVTMKTTFVIMIFFSYTHHTFMCHKPRKKTLQNCNPKVLHHKNKMGKRVSYLLTKNRVTLAYVMTPIFLPTYMIYYL
jgi:hypothetical protein